VQTENPQASPALNGSAAQTALFSVSFEQTEEDVVAMLSDLRIVGPLRRQRQRRIAVLWVSLGANGLLVFWSLLDGETTVSAFLLGAALITGALLIASLAGLAAGRRRARDRLRADLLYRMSVLGTQTVLATEHVIQSGGALQQISTCWELVSEVAHGRHSVILFSGDRYLLGVPFRAFSAPEAIVDFEALVLRRSAGRLTRVAADAGTPSVA
jgi:hypothetical protein